MAKEAFLERFILDQNERVRLGWNTAMLIRTKNPPRIESLYMKTRKQRMDEEIEGLKNWVAATGGKVIYKH